MRANILIICFASFAIGYSVNGLLQALLRGRECGNE